jgi:Peptidase C10 family/Spi protease inhibitor/PKD-like domain/Secretion system C-terminal sorting domain
MKKFILFSALLLATSLSFGAAVTVETARLTGFHFLQQQVSSVTSETQLTLNYTSYGKTGSACFYVFNAPVGFVMVSANDAVRPILAYSKDMKFDGNNIPPSSLSLLNFYRQQIEYVNAMSITATAEIADKWNSLVNYTIHASAAKTTYGAVCVAPLLPTLWDQAPGYNQFCPYNTPDASLCVTGCVATATAQVMRYWSWPANGVGSHTYNSGNPYVGTLSANFAGTTYNWAAMPLTSSDTNVARLMYEVGVAVNMDYHPGDSSGSGAFVTIVGSPITNCAEYALKTYFKYSTSLIGQQRSAFTDATWITKLKAELRASRPIIYDGQGTLGGHCWVLDGYDTTSYFHCNWGWSGTSNGYYCIDTFAPPALGWGGGSGGFDASQEAIFGVQPNIQPITGTATVCAGLTTTLADVTTGGTWTSGTTSVATIDPSTGVVYGVAGGTSNITYSVSGSTVTKIVTVNPAPTAGTITSVGGVSTICITSVLTLSDGTSGGTWSSTTPSVASVNASSGIVTGIGAGTTTITYTTSNTCGTAHAYYPITVNAGTPLTTAPTISPTGTTPCAGTAATYTATSAGATSFFWTVSGTGWSGASSSASINTTVGTGMGTLTVFGSNACGTGPTATINVTPNAAPVAPTVAMVGTIPCTGTTSVNYTGTASGATSYNWTILGTGWSGSSSTGSIAVTLGTGTGTIICSASNTCGTGSSDTTYLNPNPNPAAPTVTMTGAMPCATSTSTSYSATSTGATSFSWSVLGTGWSGSSTTSSVVVGIGSGTGSIICNATNACGTTSDTTYLTPSAGVPGAASPILSTTSLCAGSTATFITSPISGATSYVWNVGGTGWSGTSTTNMITVTVGSGAGTISVYGANSCGTGASYYLSSIIPVTNPTSTFTVAHNTIAVGYGDVITYTGTGTATSTYSWNYAGGTATPGTGMGPNTVIWSSTGTKVVSLSVTESGCTSTVYSDTVHVVTTTDLANIIADNSNIFVYPNPSNGSFDIMFGISSPYPAVVRLTDLQGRVVYNANYAEINNKLSINAEGLPSGLYTATIVTDGFTYNRKVVISK